MNVSSVHHTKEHKIIVRHVLLIYVPMMKLFLVMEDATLVLMVHGLIKMGEVVSDQIGNRS